MKWSKNYEKINVFIARLPNTLLSYIHSIVQYAFNQSIIYIT